MVPIILPIEERPPPPLEVGTATAPVANERVGSAKPARAPASDGDTARLLLVTDPTHVEALSQAPMIAAHARNKGTVRLFKAIYYDTPTCALYRAGVTLSIHHTGKRHIQRVELLAENRVDPSHHGKWETPVAFAAPDLRALAPLISVELQSALSGQAVQVVFEAEWRRHLRDIELAAGVVQVAFDRGSIRAGDKTAPICDVEIGLKRAVVSPSTTSRWR